MILYCIKYVMCENYKKIIIKIKKLFIDNTSHENISVTPRK